MFIRIIYFIHFTFFIALKNSSRRQLLQNNDDININCWQLLSNVSNIMSFIKYYKSVLQNTLVNRGLKAFAPDIW